MKLYEYFVTPKRLSPTHLSFDYLKSMGGLVLFVDLFGGQLNGQAFQYWLAILGTSF